jgi:hypothetical protein
MSCPLHAPCAVSSQMADAYEFVDPKDILSELKKDFWEGLGAAKWSERKAALTQLKDLAAAPKLANGDYGDVNRCAQMHGARVTGMATGCQLPVPELAVACSSHGRCIAGKYVAQIRSFCHPS